MSFYCIYVIVRYVIYRRELLVFSILIPGQCHIRYELLNKNGSTYDHERSCLYRRGATFDNAWYRYHRDSDIFPREL